jgi:small subunit ribosomal protein S8
MTDPISDMLTRIRNAVAARHDSVRMPYSKIKEAIAKILLENNYIAGVKVDKTGAFKVLEIELMPINPVTPAISSLVRVSKPGRRVYAGVDEIPLVLSGRGIIIISTSNGIMTGRDARKQGLGGELICKVY